MAFSEDTVRSAFVRAGGRCECERMSCGVHGTIWCGRELAWTNRGRYGEGAWEANHRHRVESDGPDSLSNCEILCWPCHRGTF